MSEAIIEIHERWMVHAIRLAEKAYESNEIPVGAIVVKDSKIIGKGYNQREQLNDPTAHAEIIAITDAANTIDDWRLNDCTLYVTKEPCAMCAGAAVNARLPRLVWGADDPKGGAGGSVIDLLNHPQLNHRVEVTRGVLADEAASLLQAFFAALREED